MRRSRIERQYISEYQAKCLAFADALRFKRVATEEELGQYAPGSTENPGDDLHAWVFYYAHCVRMCDRLKDSSAKASHQPASEDVVLEALRDAPESVRLTDGSEIRVYPKSFVALRAVQSCQDRINWMLERRDLLSKYQGAEELDFLARVDEAITRDYQVIVLIATSEGPQLPFSPFDGPTEIPERIATLSPVDYVLVHRGFLTANAIRLHVLTTMLDQMSGAEGGTRASWSTFFATRAEDSHLPASTLMSDRSLVSQVAAALLTADARKIPDEKQAA
ncbi:MAG: hypothetical protein H0U59_00405 [Gemmatimonadaceae bacterium]|nr:hypothetical protein [Gemmatimonadaceae bacterium]MBA3761800.1 hypothetical protein [Chthoniobacterales bacterium]